MLAELLEEITTEEVEELMVLQIQATAEAEAEEIQIPMEVQGVLEL